MSSRGRWRTRDLDPRQRQGGTNPLIARRQHFGSPGNLCIGFLGSGHRLRRRARGPGVARQPGARCIDRGGSGQARRSSAIATALSFAITSTATPRRPPHVVACYGLREKMKSQ